jgi:SAM-dependent methyltransferase
MKLPRKITNKIRSIRQRWGNHHIKHALWDSEYAAGKWDHCEHTPGAIVYRFVERYCRNGSILDLGCGSGNTGNELDSTKYHDYTGVDISEIATHRATERSKQNGRAQKNRYIHGDIISCVPDREHDVILFRESIYYIPRLKIKPMLNRYSRYLSSDGVFIVNVSKYGTRKGQVILNLIDSNFRVIEKHLSSGAEEFVVIFR